MDARVAGGRKLNDRTEQQIRERHNKRKRMRRRRVLISRAVIMILLTVVIVFVLIFLTPIFNIKSVDIVGNERITIESLQEYLSALQGKNIFEVSNSYVEKKLEAIAYIDKVKIDKKYFPSKVKITITEKNPCAFVETEDGFEVIDDKCVSLEKRTEKPTEFPELVTYFDSFSELLKNEEATKTLTTFFEIINRIELKEYVTAIKLYDYNDLEFEYDNRLTVECGSNVELEQKLRLFKATINNPNLSANAHGVIDLSTPGKAMHKP